MGRKKKRILFISSTGFASAYSGTQHFINSLVKLGYDLKLIVFSEKGEASFYEQRFDKVKIFEKYSPDVKFQPAISLYRIIYILINLLSYDKAIITEGYILNVSRYAKRLKPSLTIIQYCQELWYSKDHPWSKQARLFDKYSHVPDIVIDVEPNRARIRKELFHLKEPPYVLLNTLPLAEIPDRGKIRSLPVLAGCRIPQDIPLIIYTGGSGSEKPFNRLIEIMSRVASKHFFLAIINTDIIEIREFEKYAENKLDSNSFTFLPSMPRAKILEALWEADCGLIDYAYSNQPTYNQKYCAPTKLFEYMASGIAVAGSNNDSLRSIIEENGIGYCADDDTTEDFAKKIDLLISDPAELKTKKERSYHLFRNRYCFEKVNHPVIAEIASYLDK
jgi:glycosyltransferase involved in cell wall biosynthesis